MLPGRYTPHSLLVVSSSSKCDAMTSSKDPPAVWVVILQQRKADQSVFFARTLTPRHASLASPTTMDAQQLGLAVFCDRLQSTPANRCMYCGKRSCFLRLRGDPVWDQTPGCLGSNPFDWRWRPGHVNSEFRKFILLFASKNTKDPPPSSLYKRLPPSLLEVHLGALSAAPRVQHENSQGNSRPQPVNSEKAG
eukprot:5486087-Pyramimonas_sp.AAC.1